MSTDTALRDDDDPTETYAVAGGLTVAALAVVGVLAFAFGRDSSAVPWEQVARGPIGAWTSGAAAPAAVFVTGAVPDVATKTALLSAVARVFPLARLQDRVRVQPDLTAADAEAEVAVVEKFGDVKRIAYLWRGGKVSLDGSVYASALPRVRAGFDALAEPLRGTFTVHAVQKPTVEPAQVKARIAAFLADKVVEFDVGADTITPRGRAVLDGVVPFVKSVQGVDIEVQGHTDSDGDARFNKELSQRRASAVRAYMMGQGVTVKLTAIGYGAARPKVQNDTPDNKAKNRRIAFEASEQD